MRSTPERFDHRLHSQHQGSPTSDLIHIMNFLLPLLAVVGLAVQANGNLCAEHSFDLPPLNIGHPQDCSRFTMCVGNVAHVRECAPGMQWSQAIRNCDLTEVANCVETEPEVIPTEGPVDPNNPCSRNVNFELIASATECNEYIVCACGVPNVQRCAAGLVFDSRTQTCNTVAAATCVSVATARPTCPRQPGNLPHPNDCKHFFLCLGQGAAPQLRRCEANLNFDRTRNLCARVPCSLATRSGMAGFARMESVERVPRFAAMAMAMEEESSEQVVADLSEE